MQNLPNPLTQQLDQVVAYIADCKARRLPYSVVAAYWHVGRLTVSNCPEPSQQATYLLRLAKRFETYPEAGMTPTRLRQCVRFFTAFPEWTSVHPELSWTHYQILQRLTTPEQRAYYSHTAAAHHWSTQQLRRQIQSQQYERIHAPSSYLPFIKDTYILEFTDLPTADKFSESTLENALIDKMQDFLLELGNGFSFVARQKMITTATGKRFYIDLVFYHIELRRFVLIDLKITPLGHADIGQMDMYVRLYENRYRQATDQPTIGVVLCPSKDPTIVQYSVISER